MSKERQRGMDHPRIQELRRSMPLTRRFETIAFETRAAAAAAGAARKSVAELLGENKIPGYALAWNERDSWGTKLLRGCADKSVRERGPGSQSHNKIKMLWQHKPDDPIGIPEVMESDEVGLYVITPIDPVPSGERALVQVKRGTLEGLSGGFNIVWEKVYYDESDDSIVVPEIDLVEYSIVTFQAAEAAHVRSMTPQELDNLREDAEYFISTLPRHLRQDAREIITRYQALNNLQPQQQNGAKATGREALEGNKPSEKRGININYLLDNLKI